MTGDRNRSRTISLHSSDDGCASIPTVSTFGPQQWISPSGQAYPRGVEVRRSAGVLAMAATVAALVIPQPADAALGFLREFGSESVPQSDPNYLFNPYGVTVAGTPDRKVYVSSQTGRITAFNSDGSRAQVVLAEASPLFAEGDGIAESAGKLYVADTTNNRVVVLSTSGALLQMWGWGVADGSNAFQTCTSSCQAGIAGSGAGQLNFPGGIAVDGVGGGVYVADDRNHRIAKFTTAGGFVKNIGKNNGDGSRGTGEGEFTNPTGVAVRGELFVSEQGSLAWAGGHRVQKLTLEGGFLAKWGSLGSADGQFNFPDDITVDSQGNSWVIEPAPNARAQKFDPNGQFLTKIHETAGRAFSAHGITLDAEGKVYVLDTENGRVLVYGEQTAPGPGPEPGPGSTPAPGGGTESDPCARASAAFLRAFPGAPPARAAAPVNEVKIISLKGAAEVKYAGCGEWKLLAPGATLKQGDELNVDPDGEVVLEFGDNSRVTVRETSQLKIASFFTQGGIARTELLLKVGQFAAKVNKSETTRSDFRVKSPSGPGSVRGTTFGVFADSKGSLWSVRKGTVSVKGKRGRARLVRGGREVEVTSRGVGPIARLGRAGAPRRGLNRAGAWARVNRVLAGADEPCGFAVRNYSLRRTRTGWSVSVTLAGRTRGRAAFRVVRRKQEPRNQLARRLARGCR